VSDLKLLIAISKELKTLIKPDNPATLENSVDCAKGRTIRISPFRWEMIR